MNEVYFLFVLHAYVLYIGILCKQLEYDVWSYIYFSRPFYKSRSRNIPSEFSMFVQLVSQTEAENVHKLTTYAKVSFGNHKTEVSVQGAKQSHTGSNTTFFKYSY